MYKYVLRRLLLLIPVMIAVSFIVYFIVDLAPGDVVDVIAGLEVTSEEKDAMREDMGLNDPLIVRYFRYMANLVRGDLGISYLNGKGVFETYIQKLPATIELAILGSIIAVAIAIPLGIVSAVNQNTWVDTTSMVFGLLGLSMPIFWMGQLLILVFGWKLGWFPTITNDNWISIVLPSITIGIGDAALIMRTTRTSLLEVLRQDYLRTARAKGVSEEKVITKHAFKNALIPIITVYGTQLSTTLGGAVVTESVFAWPGVGRLVVDSIHNRDTAVVTGSIIMTTLLTSVVVLIVDIAYAYVDPRIKARYSK